VEVKEDVVVEQGTTIVKKVEGEKRKRPFVEENEEDEDEDEEGQTLVEEIEEEKMKKRKTPFVESEDEDEDEDEIHKPIKEIEVEEVEKHETPFVRSEDGVDEVHMPVKKAKRVAFAEELVEAYETEESVFILDVLEEKKDDGEMEKDDEFDELFDE
jgi:hypothetical protein